MGDSGDVLLLRVEEAARRLGLKRSATWTLVQKQALPSVKIGGARRILVSDLEEFVTRLREPADEV